MGRERSPALRSQSHSAYESKTVAHQLVDERLVSAHRLSLKDHLLGSLAVLNPHRLSFHDGVDAVDIALAVVDDQMTHGNLPLEKGRASMLRPVPPDAQLFVNLALSDSGRALKSMTGCLAAAISAVRASMYR